MKTKIIFLILFLSYQIILPQKSLRLNFAGGNGSKALPYVQKKGLVFASLKSFAKATGLNYFYNREASKIEIKHKNLRIKFTAKNQYVIVADKESDEIKIFQMPLSALPIKNDVFVPLKYSLSYLQLALGKKITFDASQNSLTVGRVNFQPEGLESNSISKSQKEKIKSANKINSKYDIYKVEISKKANGTLIRLFTNNRIGHFSSTINEGKLFLFLSGVKVNPNLFKNFKATGLVKSAKLKKIGGNIQLEFKLRKGYESQESFIDKESNDLLVAVHNKKLSKINSDTDKFVSKWKFGTVIIDPGHGGKDAGAIGVTGVKEKDVNLAIALELGKLIKKNLKNIKVVFTRKTDKFVELYKRGKIANKHHGNLFISLHCNSLRIKPSRTNGFEIYLLRPGRTKEAIRIAEYENSVIKYEDDPQRYKKLTAENFILVSMAHSAFMRYSEKFSELLNEELSRHTKLKSRGVKQAGFYVLVGASMPGVLIETGYLANYKDERYLNSRRGQKAIAKSIYLAIKKYIDYYSKTVK